MERQELDNFKLNIETNKEFRPLKTYRGRFLVNCDLREVLLKENRKSIGTYKKVYEGHCIGVTYNKDKGKFWFSFKNDSMQSVSSTLVGAELGVAMMAVNKYRSNLKNEDNE